VRPQSRYPAILLAVGAGGVVLSAIGLVLFVSMRRDSDEELCRANLTIIGMAIRSGELPSSPKWDAAGTGRAFFANPERWPTYQQRPIDVCCPVKGTHREIDYRGPARPLREIQNGEPIASDRPGNHGPKKGGNVLLKTGQVYTVAERDPLWSAAAQTTSD
jgi:hypothetical protein